LEPANPHELRTQDSMNAAEAAEAIQSILEEHIRSESDNSLTALMDWIVIGSSNNFDEGGEALVFSIKPADQLTYRTIGLVYTIETMLINE